MAFRFVIFPARFSADVIEPVNRILGISYTVSGTENIDKKKAFVVVCNHQSSLDVLATLQVSTFIKNIICFKFHVSNQGPML
jgi:1-acyl-sn-glycerol-3-phosphate acyltransferase